MLRVVVLGAAAGGGVPQWNCGCRICRAARDDHPELQTTQASIAISADGEHWFLINASPDLRQQLLATPQLHPKPGQLRHTPIAGVILTNGEIDAVTGLLSMRELTRNFADRYKEETVRRYVFDLKRCGLIALDGRGPNAVVQLAAPTLAALADTIRQWIVTFRDVDRRVQKMGAF